MEAPTAWHREVSHPDARRGRPCERPVAGASVRAGWRRREALSPASGAGTARSVPAPGRTIVVRFLPRHLAVGVAVVLMAALLGWVPASPAAAHGELISSDPAEGAVFAALPSRAFLVFSDAVSEVRGITVVGPGGSVTNGAPTSVGAEVRQTLWAGADGGYTMEYFVVLADGHDLRGEVHFEVGSTATAADAATSGVGANGDEVRWSERGRDVILPAGLVVLAAAVALALLRRARAGRPGHV